MHNAYKVVLFGHRDFSGYRILDVELFELLKDLISAKEFLEIFVGHNGEFDIYAASVVKRVQRIVGKINNELICMLPYPVKNIEYYDAYYDSVQVFESRKTHPKGLIAKRNRYLVEACDLMICYVERMDGGAYQAMRYASRLNKKIINLAHRQVSIT